MRASIITLVVFHSLLPVQDGQDDQAGPTPIVIGHEFKLESSVLGETRKIMIGLPRDYEQSTSRCGVAYVLDGEFLFATAAAAVRHNEDEHLPLIVVGIKNTDRLRDLTPEQVSQENGPLQMPGGGGAEPFRRFLIEELRPFLEANYRTNDLSLLIGHSLGGLFVFDTLVHRPEAFTGYLCLSPSLWWDGQSLLERFKGLPYEHALYSRFLFLSIGDEGAVGNVEFEKVEWHIRENAPPSFRWHAAHFPGKDHWPVASPSLYEGLLAFFSPLTELREDKAIRSFEELKRRYGEVSSLFGVEVLLPSEAVSGMAGRVARTGDPEAGLRILDDAEEMFTETWDLQYVRGHVLVMLKRYDEAIAVLEALLEQIEGQEDERWSMTQKVLETAKNARDEARREAPGGADEEGTK